jgi:hypothetical protein
MSTHQYYTPGCCPGCEIFRDDLLANDIGNYNQRSGSWQINAPGYAQRLTTTDDGALIRGEVASPTPRGRVQATVEFDTPGQSAGIIGSYVDEDNLVYLDLFYNGSASTIKLWQRVAGVETQLGPTFTTTLPAERQVYLCWNGSQVQAYVPSTFYGFWPLAGFTEAYAGVGRKFGLRAFANGGRVRFKAPLIFSRHPDDNGQCAGCVQSCCRTAGQPPASVYATFRKVAPFGASACTPAGPWTVTCAQDAGFPPHAAWRWGPVFGSSLPCAIGSFEISCTPEGRSPYADVTDCARPDFLSVSSEERWYTFVLSHLIINGVMRPKSAVLLSCKPLHLLFQFTECINTIGSWSHGPEAALQGWEVEVTE